MTCANEVMAHGWGAEGAPGQMKLMRASRDLSSDDSSAVADTAAAEVPWLILDDPVQSMDEVHIAQFAALLRTLSKAHGRQTIIAVHDRPLFEYLALELSPAFDNDGLITVELGRSPTGAIVAEPTFHAWKPDSVAA